MTTLGARSLSSRSGTTIRSEVKLALRSFRRFLSRLLWQIFRSSSLSSPIPETLGIGLGTGDESLLLGKDVTGDFLENVLGVREGVLTRLVSAM